MKGEALQVQICTYKMGHHFLQMCAAEVFPKLHTATMWATDRFYCLKILAHVLRVDIHISLRFFADCRSQRLCKLEQVLNQDTFVGMTIPNWEGVFQNTFNAHFKAF